MRNRSTLVNSIRIAVMVGTLAAISLVARPVGASSAQEIRLRDDCDAASFNAALGPGACVGNGDTTLDEFNAELAARHSVGAWKYNPDHTKVDVGQSIVVVNRGGETHTFTKVAAFGGGFVAALNQAAGNLTPRPECAAVQPDGSLRPQPAGPNNMFVPAGTQVPGPIMGDGTVMFQCCIHPWMRVVITPHH
jgi:plastocyanin